MAALRDVTVQGTGLIKSSIAAGPIGFGVALKWASATTCQAATADNTDPGVIIGFSAQPANGVVLDVDGFYQLSNNAAIPDQVRVIKDGYANLLVCSKGAYNILEGDYLEMAILGAAGSGVGVLEEAGAGGNVGETKVTTALARAEEGVTTASMYQHPASNTEIGDKTSTFTSGNLTSLDVTPGDYCILADANGGCQLNRVKSMTATVITWELAATNQVATGDYVYKVFQCLCQIVL
jgi:hypothetical protein